MTKYRSKVIRCKYSGESLVGGTVNRHFGIMININNAVQRLSPDGARELSLWLSRAANFVDNRSSQELIERLNKRKK